MDNRQNSTNINWYPGHMAKTKRLIKEKLPVLDIVYELVDARIPYSSRVLELDDVVGSLPRLIIMTKSDLCDIKETTKWVKYYEDLGYNVILTNLEEPKAYQEIVKKTYEIVQKEKDIKALVVGIPNVGKSTLINHLAQKKVTQTGNKPGVTTSLNWLKTNYNILLLDTPGILWPKLEQEEGALNLAAMNAIKEEILPLDEVVIHILKKLSLFYPEILQEQYGLSKIDDDYEKVYETIANFLKIPKINGEIDYDKINKRIYNDLKNAKIKGITFDRK